MSHFFSSKFQQLLSKACHLIFSFPLTLTIDEILKQWPNQYRKLFYTNMLFITLSLYHISSKEILFNVLLQDLNSWIWIKICSILKYEYVLRSLACLFYFNFFKRSDERYWNIKQTVKLQYI